MTRRPRYSRAAGSVAAQEAHAQGAGPQPAGTASAPPAPSSGPTRRQRLRTWLVTPAAIWTAWGLLALALLGAWQWQLHHAPPVITQEDIDRAVLQTLDTQPLPAATRKAADKILPSVVRVVAQADERDESLPSSKAAGAPRQKAGAAGKNRPAGKAAKPTGDDEHEEDSHPRRGIGTGVVIVESGLILTNYHVIEGASRVTVTFWNGMEAEARIVSTQPHQDLAVLKALKLPDDLQPATLRGTSDLGLGDTVVAVGYPFGIGPSVSSGVVSGLDREFRAPEGQQTLRRLIQFDAAANPGNSGGPLVNAQGEVVGIVTAILNPTSARTFIGIGFAVPIESAAGAVGFPPF
ncbi:S1C family serine protease [Leptothrix discophora]|uniref:Trypsin-like peptidase domain-containing protein n=1 Tax=Leptothrix discophora TaxID=89 RepID=A0ABT9G1V1_LEPDI|nr:trypsin-like peptidase domain-containing protein [Leptothrix discophora]MDP4300469.1 trypsin-like peptidase domain-containing protein [Leptothrix discophora]